MTAVANPPTFPQISRPAWGTISGNNPMNTDEVRGMFVPRKTLSRSNSSSSISSTSSATSVATNGSQSNGTSISSTSDLSQWSGSNATRKRPPSKSSWTQGKGNAQQDFSRLPPQGRPNGIAAATPGAIPSGPGQPQVQSNMMRPMAAEPPFPAGQPMLNLLPLNGTFERKTISVPFAPDCIRIGRQTNQKTVPSATNGFFDSKVLSRQHAEIFAERSGKIFIRDVKSSNGTFVNGTRLSQENRESDPHELQTSDHLELGIDIVSEDQKTVVHHKVAAKVEHAGFLNASNNVMDMNFGDLDPANNTMMISSGAMQMRGRSGSNVAMSNNARMMAGSSSSGGGMAQLNGMAAPRPFFLSPIATDQILKRLSSEMRNARQQGEDLNRTNQFINALLSKEDIKDLEKPGAAERQKPPPQVNGHGAHYRADPKARFSDPPAPPPQQPLPEKPDVPSLKRGPTERPRSGPPNASPVRQENLSQIMKLTEDLNNAKRDMDMQMTRMRELESMLQKEREKRELAEEVAKKLEELAYNQISGVVKTAKESVQGMATAEQAPESSADASNAERMAQETAAALQSRIDTMDEQMRVLRESMEQWRRRCEVAEAERDVSQKSLAEMVIQLREEEARRIALQERRKSRTRSSCHEQQQQPEGSKEGLTPSLSPSSSGLNLRAPEPRFPEGLSSGIVIGAEANDELTLSRIGSITPRPSQGRHTLQGQRLQAGLPYASMVGVVLIGMGLMAYVNGWQNSPRIER